MRIVMTVFLVLLLLPFWASAEGISASLPMPSDSLEQDCLRAVYTDLPSAFLSDPQVLESMAQDYPLEPLRPECPEGQHPGRVRSYALLRQLYGSNKDEVQARLHTVSLFGHSLSLAPAAAQAFKRVGQRLEAAVREKPQLLSYILPLGGFFWRRISGEERLSPHSFGIAVDLNPATGPYWRWSSAAKRRAQGSSARAKYPPEIVAAFEAEGFIWGGKWHEYDLMHFEYRPEFICKARKKAALVDAAALRELGKN